MSLSENKRGVAQNIIIFIIAAILITGLAVKSYYMRNPITETVIEIVEVEMEVTKTTVAVEYEQPTEPEIIYTVVTDSITCNTALDEHTDYEYNLYNMATDETTCAETTDGFCAMTDRGVRDISLYVDANCCLMKCKIE